MIDSLFVKRRCILHITQLGEHVRENRNLFLSKKGWHTFKGYAYSQIHKMQTKNPQGKRKASVEKFGYDLKYATHCIRLLAEVEQMFTEGTIDLEANREQLKAILRGEWAKEQVIDYFNSKERELETLYQESKAIPHRPNEAAIKKLLLECLEMHFGSLAGAIHITESEIVKALVSDVKGVLEKY